MKKTLLQMFLSVFVMWAIFSSHTQVQENFVQVFGEENTQAMLPVLMYHSILKDRAQQGDYILHPDVLAQDLDYLLENGYETVVISDLVAFVQDGTPLPKKPVMITFDDGHYNNYLYAYPLLAERGMEAVVSIIGKQSDLFTENGEVNPYWSYLNRDHLQEMAASGVFEVQNHSYDLHESSGRRGTLQKRGEDEEIYKKVLEEDIGRVQDMLESWDLPRPVCYTYPFGYYSKLSEQALQDMGFLSTLVCEERINVITRDPQSLYKLGRYNRPAGMSTYEFMSKALAQ